MSSNTSHLHESADGKDVFRMGGHDDIPSPVYIPELKGAEGLHAVLDHVDALDPKNPIMVPAAKWSWLRGKKEITARTDGEGNHSGIKEIEELEENHPLAFYDPPELYNYKRTKTLTNYLFKHGGWEQERFEKHAKRGNHSDALAELPEFAQPFVHANYNRVLEELDGASQVSESDLKISSPEEAWTSLEQRNFDDYYQVIANEAAKRPSTVIIPPVPQLSYEWHDDLVTAWCTSNSRMAHHTVDRENCETYFHLYMDYRTWDTETSDDTASRSLKILERELEHGNYAGIALTVHRPNRIWQTNRAARMETFMTNLSRLGSEFQIPIICPRSEWFGSYVTDYGIQGFSSLMNGAWQYQRYSSGGGPTGADKYGKVMIPNEARALKLQSDTQEDLEGYIEANGGLPEVDGLPSKPPTYDSDGSSLKEKFGTSPKFRQTFGKPRRLGHVKEAQKFRKDRTEGIENPAREYLRDSKNPYIEI